MNPAPGRSSHATRPGIQADDSYRPELLKIVETLVDGVGNTLAKESSGRLISGSGLVASLNVSGQSRLHHIEKSRIVADQPYVSRNWARRRGRPAKSVKSAKPSPATTERVCRGTSRGLGRALLDHTADRAAASSQQPARADLDNLCAPAWNAPYHAPCGFRVLDDTEITPGLQAIREWEAAMGVDRWPRVCMRRDL